MTREQMLNDLARAIIELKEVKSWSGIMRLSNRLLDLGYRKQSEGEWMATCVCNIFQCTNCKKTTVFDEFCNGVFSPKAYCPNCGAKMKGADNGNI